MKRHAVITVLLCAALNLSGVNGAEADDLRIGLAIPVSGPFAIYGAQILAGVQQAADDLNAKGGVLKSKVLVVTYDDQCDPSHAKQVVQRLVDEDKVPLVIGPVCSSAALAALPVFGANKKSVVDILPAATASMITEEGYKNIFRIVPRADRQGLVASNYLRRLNGYNIAVLTDETPYGADIDTALRRSWTTLEADTKILAKYSFQQADFSPLIQRLRQSDIKVVYVAGVPIGLANLVRKSRDEGLRALFVSSDAASSPLISSELNGSTDNLLFTFIPDPTNRPEAEPILERMRAKGRSPSIYGFYAYAALQVWVQAVNAATTYDAEKVSSTLRGQHFDSAVGPIAFDDKGDVKDLDYVFYRWQDGKINQMNHRPPPPPPPP